MRSILTLLICCAIAGCEGRAEPIEIVRPEGVPETAVALVNSLDAPVAVRPVCPAGQAEVEGTCRPIDTAYVSAGGRTYYVDNGRSNASDTGPGTAEQPWRTISRAARVGALQPGDAVVVRAGVYRETVAPRVGGRDSNTRVTYAAYPGETVVVTGADPADSGWTSAGGNRWRKAYTGPELPTYGDGDWHFRRPLVVSRGEVLRPVQSVANLQPGTFTTEGPDDRPTALVAQFVGSVSPAEAAPIEIATRTYLFQPQGDNPYLDCGDPATPGWIRVVGFTFRHAANRAQWGAVCAGSVGGLVEDVTVEWTNGAGVDGSGRGHAFRRVRAEYNGQIGWVATCTDCLFEDGAAVGNNWKGHDPFWEAGGGKWQGTSGSVIRRQYAADNDGPGIWLDGANTSNTIEGCLAVRNQMAGIMLELNTTRTLVQHNVVAETRWREWTGSGILSQAASNNVFAFNTLVANEGTGLWLRLDPDRRAPDGDNAVFNNWVVGNARRASEEAREISVEGTSVTHLRSSRFDGNAYGLFGGDPLYRSTFFANPTSTGDYRGDALGPWRTAVGSDAHSDHASGDPDGRAAATVPSSAETAGAASARLVGSKQVGAWSGVVRAQGNWRDAPHVRR